MLSGHEVIVVDNFFTGRYVPSTGMKRYDTVLGKEYRVQVLGIKFYILILLI